MLPLTFADPADYDKIKPEDRVCICRFVIKVRRLANAP